MASYKFKCTKCEKEEERDIPMSHYDEQKDKQLCSECVSKMTRVIEFSGSVKLCEGMYGANGWNN